MKTPDILNKEKFKEIYINEQFRNEVAYAHQCCDKNGNFLYLSTTSYPNRYKVTKVQQKEALKLIEKTKKIVIKENEGKLLFVGMGGLYAERYEGDICNYRIRTEFININGHKFFIELTSTHNREMKVDHAIDRDLEEKEAKNREQNYNNFKNLERKIFPLYSKSEIIALVNSNFQCNFKELIVDNYNLCTDDFICISPKK